jgi:prepilin-type N-terminal cleavage/methylation domain-containing protein
MYILFVINYQKLMKNKGFTLIELLVVVAIIGILAVAGFYQFIGFTSVAKINAVKANHNNAVKLISVEIKKCETIGGFFKLKSSSANPTLVYSDLSCLSSQTSTQQLVAAFINHLNNEGFRNPYNDVVARLGYSEVFFRDGAQQEVGQTIIKVSNNNIITLTSLFQNTDGILQTTIINTIKDER